MYAKLRLCTLIFIFYGTSVSAYWQIQTRFSIGPGWHRFTSYERYALTPLGIENFIPISETLTNEFSLMPYLEWCMRVYWGHHVNGEVVVGGGLFNHGRGIIARELSLGTGLGLRNTNNALCMARLLIVDARLGYEFGDECRGIFVNPLVGYVFNKEKVNFTLLRSTNVYALKNIWQGPYVGCEAVWYVTSSVALKPLYKFVFGQVKSTLHTSLADPPTEGVTPDTPVSWRHASMFGNILSCQTVYTYNEHWRLGSMLTYMQYQNHKRGSVVFGPGNQQFVVGAMLERLLWEQVVWDVFLEYCY